MSLARKAVNERLLWIILIISSLSFTAYLAKDMVLSVAYNNVTSEFSLNEQTRMRFPRVTFCPYPKMFNPPKYNWTDCKLTKTSPVCQQINQYYNQTGLNGVKFEIGKGSFTRVMSKYDEFCIQFNKDGLQHQDETNDYVAIEIPPFPTAYVNKTSNITDSILDKNEFS